MSRYDFWDCLIRRFKLFENCQRREGKQVSHDTAKEILIGLAAAEAERVIRKKGLSMHEGEWAKACG
ncbi:hypothetical protein HOY80DRAFT_1057119 [Tuber brumale]|nr:hypothetical protein HOY80DRAFT_1057119 [Tuber brumale]